MFTGLIRYRHYRACALLRLTLANTRLCQNVEYARTLLLQLERSLPQLKQPNRRHEAQEEIARDRQLLKRMEALLAEEDTLSPAHDESDGDDGEWAEFLSQPISTEKTSAPSEANKPMPETTSTATSTATKATAAPTPTAAPEQPSTLRNRQNPHAQPSNDSTAKTTGSNANNSRLPDSEEALSAQRLEQEDLTSSLLSLAGQLKASSKSFQSTLENEQSVLDRAVTGMDKTSSTMEAAGKRMGMLRRMTEGKGWWGRMMLYAWIFGLWLVAVLIVFLGPKLRF